jgi:HSP20 family protein
MYRNEDSFRDVQELLERIRKQFQQAADHWERPDGFDSLGGVADSVAVDIVEDDEAFVVSVDLPGFESDDVDVRVTDHRLYISASSGQAREERDAQFVRRERHHSAVERTLALPGRVRADAVSASMNNGVLTITLPKQSPESAHEVEIQ